MKWHLVFASFISGLLLATGWITCSGVLLFVAFVPVILIDFHFAEKKANQAIYFWAYAFIAVFSWNVISTWWIWNATPAGASFAIVINSLLMSMVLWFIHETRKVKGNAFANFLFVFAWLSFEFLHFNWDMEWPWLTLGNGLANNIKLIQWYEYTGVFGGSLWILLVNLFIANSVKSFTLRKYHSIAKFLIPGITLFAVPIIISQMIFRNYSEGKDPVEIVIVQPNIDPYVEKFDRSTYTVQYEKMLAHLLDYDTTKVDFFLLPETALHNVWLSRAEDHRAVRQFQNYLHRRSDSTMIVTGAMAYRQYFEPENSTHTARFNRDSTFVYDAFNTALLITEKGVVQAYHKNKLVSGVEKMPFGQYLQFLKKLVVDLGGTSGTLATDGQQTVFVNSTTQFAVPVCYESVFGAYVGNFIKNGAELLFVITNDGWWKNTPGYKQHFSFARILAIEHRRSIARSGNTGISAFINQSGEVLQSTNWWEDTAVYGEINKNSEITFYTEHGDFIARIAVFMFVLMGFSMIVEKIKGKRNRIILLCKTPNIQDLSA